MYLSIILKSPESSERAMRCRVELLSDTGLHY
jgi:hypothetical protein